MKIVNVLAKEGNTLEKIIEKCLILFYKDLNNTPISEKKIK